MATTLADRLLEQSRAMGLPDPHDVFGDLDHHPVVCAGDCEGCDATDCCRFCASDKVLCDALDGCCDNCLHGAP